MKWLLKLLLYAYRSLASPWLGSPCRFSPSCSEYALQAVDQHHPLRAVCLIITRLLRCHPWGGSGYDPLPSIEEKSASKPHT